MCLNLHEPGKTHLPLFHELHIRSNVSGRTARLAGGLIVGADVMLGCKEARAH